ncbi:MAG: lactate racemase domain-containing protein [Anaerolineaceae bacterium]
MVTNQVFAQKGSLLTEEQIINTLSQALRGKYKNQKLLVLVPDHTRSMPLPFVFRKLVEILNDTTQLDFMVALGTHSALTNQEMNQLFDITDEQRRTEFKHISLFNHAWNQPSSLISIGRIEKDQIRQIAGNAWHESLPDVVDVTINKAVFDYDQVLIVGPTFPHEVVGFSGGAKYIFPGISGPEMINATHWLAALSGVSKTIGIKDTPVREMIHTAARMINKPITLVACVVEGRELSGMFVGDLYSAWNAAADLSSQRHIHWCDRPYQRVLSAAPAMYDELWVAGKAMYKLEPAVAVGGELIIFAPHLETISRVHGKYIFEAGYHTLAYFLANWERYKNIPLSVLAHCTHVRGWGVMENGVEKPNINVILASKISPQDCARINLGYCDPDSIDIRQWQDKEDQGILYVPHAGEELYRVKPE